MKNHSLIIKFFVEIAHKTLFHFVRLKIGLFKEGLIGFSNIFKRKDYLRTRSKFRGFQYIIAWITSL